MKNAFALLELLVATTLMSILLVLLLNMVDGATQLWRANENRVDSCREARAALGIMSQDLQNTIAVSANTNFFLLNSNAWPVLAGVGPAMVANPDSGGALLFLAALSLSAQESGNRSDVCQVGYFIAFGKSSTVTNAPVNTMNLYRYLLGSDATFTRLTNSSQPVFPPDLTTTHSNVDLLARNITGLKIAAYTVTNSSVLAFAPSTNTPLPDLVEISVSAINRDASKKLPETAGAWTDTNSTLFTNIIAPALQTFTTRIKLNRPQ